MSVEGPKPLRLVVDPEQRAASSDARDGGRRDAGGPPDLSPDPGSDDDARETERDDGADEPSAESGGRGRGGALRGVLALVALVVFAGAAWYAYTWGVGEVAPEDLPVIEAEPGPIKSRPESPGGMEVPYQDQAILNDAAPNPDKPQVERLLPPPETPAPPQPLQETAPKVPAMPAPEPVAELPVKAPEPVAEAAPAPPAETATGGTATTETAPAEAAAAPGTTAGEVAPSAPAAGDWVVQLASLKSRDGVTTEWARLQKKFPELLGPRALDIQTVDLSGKGTYHRLRVGYFADRAAAVRFCDRLKAGGQDCLAAKR